MGGSSRRLDLRRAAKKTVRIESSRRAPVTEDGIEDACWRDWGACQELGGSYDVGARLGVGLARERECNMKTHSVIGGSWKLLFMKSHQVEDTTTFWLETLENLDSQKVNLIVDRSKFS